MRIIIFSIMILLSAATLNAAVIFEDNFDATTWNPAGALNDTECYVGTCANAPTNWSFYRANAPVASPKASIVAITGDHTTGSGHVFRARYSTSDYQGDSVISKHLGSNYADLYMQVWVQFPNGAPFNASGNAKVLRVLALSEGFENAYQYFTGGYLHAGALFDLGRYVNSASYVPAYRCDPQYQASGGDCPAPYNVDYNTYFNAQHDTIDATWGDGEWHRYKLHVKQNTSVGASDGKFEVWYDGTQLFSATTVQWRNTGSDMTGWNMISIGGNNVSLGTESIAYFDDLVISTTDIADDYIPGGGSPEAVTTVKGLTIVGGRIN